PGSKCAEQGFGMGVTHWRAGGIVSRVLSAGRRAVPIAKDYLGFITKGPQGPGWRDGGRAFAAERGRSGDGIPASRDGSIGHRIAGFFKLFLTYGQARSTPLAFRYTGLCCTCRTVPVASSGRSASPGAGRRIAFVAGG